MRRFGWIPLVIVIAVAAGAMVPATTHADAKSLDCGKSPTGTTAKFRHTRSRVIAKLGSPRHRGTDLIAAEGDENQTLGGKLAYGKTDKDLEDEDVEIFACLDQAWTPIATTKTSGDGRFTVVLRGTSRLPVGMTDLYAHVPGDGSGVAFLGFVAAKGEEVIVSDIDGTLTASENSIYNTLLTGRDIDHQPGAPEAFAQSGKTIVYITARGDQLTDLTRAWLTAHGFPKGPVRLAPSLVTLPGEGTARLKTRVITALGVPVAAAVGNRASDISAYARAGLTPDRIFINLPEYTTELRHRMAGGHATPFDHYCDLASLLRR